MFVGMVGNSISNIQRRSQQHNIITVGDGNCRIHSTKAALGFGESMRLLVVFIYRFIMHTFY